MKKLILLFTLISSFAFGQLKAVADKGGRLLDDFNPLGNLIYKFEQDTEIEIIENAGDYFKACYNDKCGYISELWLEPNDALKKMKLDNIPFWKAKKEAIEIEIAKEKELQKKKELSERMAKYVKKYGKTYGSLVAKRMIQQGMTKNMVIDSVGMPDTINESVGAWGTHQQWVYAASYLYFENGKLTSWQTSY